MVDWRGNTGNSRRAYEKAATPTPRNYYSQLGSFGQSSGCAQFLTSNSIVCAKGNNCTFYTPNSSNPYSAFVGYSCSNFSCCGVTVTNCSQDGFCVYTKLNDPQVKQRLTELSENQDFLVVSCGGQYKPLEAFLIEKPRKFEFRERVPKLTVQSAL